MRQPVQKFGDEPWNCAPTKLQRREQDPVPLGTLQEGDAASQNPAPESGQPWKRSKARRPFVGDVAMVELRNKLVLAPSQLPAPPAPASRAKYGMAVQVAGVAVMAAVAGIVGYKTGSGPPASMLHPAPHSSQSSQPGLVPEGLVSAAHALQSAPVPSVSPTSSSRMVSGQLKVDVVQPQQADEPTRLTVSALDAGADAAVVIGGQGNGAPAPANPPSANSQPRRLDASEIALMLKSGTGHMANGNVSAARMMFQPAAEAGDPEGAFALAETYDPLVLKKLNARGGIAADSVLAQTWYQKARDLGSAVAPERLERLARRPE